MSSLGHGVGLRPQHYADVVEPLRRGERIAAPGAAALRALSKLAAWTDAGLLVRGAERTRSARQLR